MTREAGLAERLREFAKSMGGAAGRTMTEAADALSAPASGAGMVVVPREPTEADLIPVARYIAGMVGDPYDAWQHFLGEARAVWARVTSEPPLSAAPSLASKEGTEEPAGEAVNYFRLIIDLFPPDHHFDGCLFKENRRLPCQCGYNERMRRFHAAKEKAEEIGRQWDYIQHKPKPGWPFTSPPVPSSKGG